MAMIAAACSGDDSPTETLPGGIEVPSPAPATTDEPDEGDDPAETRPPDPTGRLVLLDDDGNIVTIDPDGANPTAITSDAGDSTVYFQPTWSPDSAALAWGESRAGGFGLGTGAASGESISTVAMTALPFYFYWAPDGEHVAALHNAPGGGLQFEIVDVAGETSSVAGSGAPFYFSWSPDGDAVAVHVGADGFATIETDGETSELGTTAAGYLAPQWTDAGIIHLDTDGLRLQDPGGESRLLAKVPGPTTFVANGQGTLIAAQSFGEEQPGRIVALQTIPDLPPNAVMVLEVATGTVERATTREAVGYFWSPNGERLLILVAGDQPGHLDALVWEDGGTGLVATFLPSPGLLRNVLPFFAQYAQSFQLWSPDSSAFAFPGAIDGSEGIWVLQLSEPTPRLVSSGSWVAWSHG
jgi:TolB protein